MREFMNKYKKINKKISLKKTTKKRKSTKKIDVKISLTKTNKKPEKPGKNNIK